MFKHKSHMCTDIYPFIDRAEQAAAADRITVYVREVAEPDARVCWRGQYWTREELSQLLVAFEEAFQMVDGGDTDRPKRFLLFTGERDTMNGGWSDLHSSHDTLEEAQLDGRPFRGNFWYHIVDGWTGKIVEDGENLKAKETAPGTVESYVDSGQGFCSIDGSPNLIQTKETK